MEIESLENIVSQQIDAIDSILDIFQKEDIPASNTADFIPSIDPADSIEE